MVETKLQQPNFNPLPQLLYLPTLVHVHSLVAKKMTHIFHTLFLVSIPCLVPMRSFPQAVDTAIEGYGAWTNLLSLEIIEQA